MRNLILLGVLVFLAAPVFAQDKMAAPAASPVSPEFLNTKLWSDLGKPTEGIRGFSLFTRNMQPKSDSQFELWVRIVPTNAAAFNRRYSLPRESAYVVQFATVDCGKRLVMMERTSAFDSSNGLVDAKASDLVKNENKTRVRAGSVSEAVFQYICEKLQ